MQAKEKGRSNWQPVWSVLLVSLLIMGFMIWNVIFVQNRILHRTEKIYLQEQTENISARIAEVNQETEKMALQLAGNDRVIEAFRQGDDTQLDKMLTPVFKQWQQRYGIAQLSLISADGKAVWSSEESIKPGDDMSYQRIVNQSRRQKETVSVLESSENNTLLVTTRPLFNNDKYIGLCKIGISMPYLGSQLQKSSPGKYAIFSLNGIDSTLLWQNQKMQSSLNTADIKKLQDGDMISRSLDRNTKMLVIPLQDVDGITVAYIQNQLSWRELYQAGIMNYLMLLLMFGFILLANYACGRGESGCDDDFGDGFAKMAKINNVAFNIDADKPQKGNKQEE